jgi:vancomycin resistance protein YoaR
MSTTAYPQPQSSRGFRLNPWLIRLPVLVIIGALLVVLTLGALLVSYQWLYSDRIVPGVSALGINLSGMTEAEAAEALAQGFTDRNRAVFTFRDGEAFWQMSATELGVRFDAEQMGRMAYAIGHQGNVIRDVQAQADAWLNGVQIAPIITYDQNVALDKLDEIASEINREVVMGALSLDGTTAVTRDGTNGRRLNVAATFDRLNETLTRFGTGGEIQLVVEDIAPTASNMTEAAQRIQTALSAPVQLVATDQHGNQLGPWMVSVPQIEQLLKVTRVQASDGTQSYEVDIDMSAFEAYLETLAPGLITPPRDGRFDYDPINGTLTAIQPSVSGRTLNIAQTLERLEAGVFTENRIVPMAFDYVLPRYHNQITATELGITELVTSATTYYDASSSNRRQNIAVSAGKINGVIVGPGEEFSFNYYLGDISLENGFVEGQVIFGGRTVTGLGGGVCQVSTTVFRAAFNGGFAITERNSHGYRVGYYELAGSPPGLDAAIWQPERDFRFQNNTPYHLLIETNVYPADNALEFRFYSTQHWRAEIEPAIVKNIEPAPSPRYEINRDLNAGETLQVDYSADGADVTVYRNVYDMQGNLVIEDHTFTHYVPWQAIYQVAPGDNRLRQSG